MKLGTFFVSTGNIYVYWESMQMLGWEVWWTVCMWGPVSCPIATVLVRESEQYYYIHFYLRTDYTYLIPV